MAISSQATLWASERGLPHVLTKNGDISFICPKCGMGRIIVQGEKGWFFCFGGRCNVSGESFQELEGLFA